MRTVLLVLFLIVILLSINHINKKFKLLPMKGKYKKAKIFAIAFVVISCGLYLSGYRLSSLSAARANAFIDKDMVLMDELHGEWADVYFFFDEAENKYHTVLSEKRNFLYSSRNSVWLYNHVNDPIQTIGSISFVNRKGKSIVALLVKSMSDNIDYIEAKLGDDVYREKIAIGKSIIMSFENSHLIHELDLKAYNKNDTELYYYGYPKDTNYFEGEDYKWHTSE